MYICNCACLTAFSDNSLVMFILVLLHGLSKALFESCTFCVLESADFCPEDTFRARCPDGEFIVMVSARYGRMRIGKCIPVDLGKHTGFIWGILSN